MDRRPGARRRGLRRGHGRALSGPSASGGPGEEKPCAVCGRRIEWRARWARDWPSVRYCSDACRRRGLSAVDRQLEAALRTLLERRSGRATVCPSEAARVVAGEDASPRPGSGVEAAGKAGREPASRRGDEAWRDLMEPARMAARRLVAAGEVEITQGGRVVDPSTAKGPIRVRRRA